jgi:hypothetical protein
VDAFIELFIENFFARWEDEPPQEVREQWEKDLTAALVSAIEKDPSPIIRRQVIGFLKGKAQVAWDELQNCSPESASTLRKRAAMYDLAAEQMEGEEKEEEAHVA